MMGYRDQQEARVPFMLILFETYETKEQALRREKQIKSWKGGEAFKKLLAGK